MPCNTAKHNSPESCRKILNLSILSQRNQITHSVLGRTIYKIQPLVVFATLHVSEAPKPKESREFLTLETHRS